MQMSRVDNMKEGEGEGEEQPRVSLPKKLDTLKRIVRKHLPMLRLMRKAIPVQLEKQPSLAMRDKSIGYIVRNTWLYWYDPIDLVTNILSATFLREKMYFGMVQYQDQPTEL